MDRPSSSSIAFIAALERSLLSASMAPETAGDVRCFADLLRGLAERSTETRWPTAAAIAHKLPVQRYWRRSLAAAIGGSTAELAATIEDIYPALTWIQSPDYVRDPPSADFINNYGYAVVVGPSSGQPALIVNHNLAAGVLMLGPQTCYALHHHPATEIYFVVSGRARWCRGAGPWEFKQAGALIHHASGLPHGTWTADEPLLAIYLWKGDLDTDAQFVDRQSHGA